MTWTLATNNGNHCTAVAAIASSTSNRCSSGGVTYQDGSRIANHDARDNGKCHLKPVRPPIPTRPRDLVTIEVRQASISSTTVQIIDAYGRISSASGRKLSDHSLQINLSSRSSGVYFIRVLVGNVFKIFRVVKM